MSRPQQIEQLLRDLLAEPGSRASVLLGDGTGPLHNHHRTRDLAAAVRDATREMKASSRRL